MSRPVHHDEDGPDVGEDEVMMAKEWRNVDRLADIETSCLDLTPGCYILLRRLGDRWIGKLWPMQHDFITITATTEAEAKSEIVERARVILTESLAALPKEEA